MTIKGREHLWLIGDEMVCRTERENYTKRRENLYSLTHYENTVIAGNFTSSTKSILQRLRNCMVNTYNNNQLLLPKWIVIVVENDIIRHFKHDGCDAPFYDSVLKWLFSEFTTIREKIRANFPFKAKKYGWPYYLWVIPTLHKSYGDYDQRKTFIDSLQKINAQHDDAIAISLQNWDENDSTLFLERERRYSNTGLKTLWNSIDQTIMYADGKVLRNHGKTLIEIFKQNIWPKPDRQNATGNAHASGKVQQTSTYTRNFNRRYEGNRHYDHYNNSRATSTYIPPRRTTPTFRRDPQGMRLPPPDRY